MAAVVPLLSDVTPKMILVRSKRESRGHAEGSGVDLRLAWTPSSRMRRSWSVLSTGTRVSFVSTSSPRASRGDSSTRRCLALSGETRIDALRCAAAEILESMYKEMVSRDLRESNAYGSAIRYGGALFGNLVDNVSNRRVLSAGVHRRACCSHPERRRSHDSSEGCSRRQRVAAARRSVHGIATCAAASAIQEARLSLSRCSRCRALLGVAREHFLFRLFSRPPMTTPWPQCSGKKISIQRSLRRPARNWRKPDVALHMRVSKNGTGSHDRCPLRETRRRHHFRL